MGPCTHDKIYWDRDFQKYQCRYCKKTIEGQLEPEMKDTVPQEPLPFLTIVYTNWKGETGIRRIIPVLTYFGRSEFHDNEEHWMLKAFDVDKNAHRSFVMSDIHYIEEGK